MVAGGRPDAERHLLEGAVLAREIGRPYLEVSCLAQLGFASMVLHSFATTQRRCREAIALAERYGWGAEPVIAPALIMLAGTLIWTGEFDEGERWLQRTRGPCRQTPGRTSGCCCTTAGMLHACRGRHHEALEEFSAAEYLGSQLAGLAGAGEPGDRLDDCHPGPPRMTAEARASIAALADERASSGEIRNARAVICLAEGNPAAALSAVSRCSGWHGPGQRGRDGH